MTDITTPQQTTVVVAAANDSTNVKANISTVSGHGVWLQQVSTSSSLDVFGGANITADAGHDGIHSEGVTQKIDIQANASVSGGKGIAFYANSFVLTNTGTISGTNSGLYVDTNVSGTVTNTNTGIINGGIDSFSHALTITNEGTINGGITEQSNYAQGFFTFTNTLNATLNGGIALTTVAGEIATITNFGTIAAVAGTSTIRGSAGNETIINEGLMSGNIVLGAGDDQYIHHLNAATDGTIYGGTGDDLYHFTGAMIKFNEKEGEGVDTLELDSISTNYIQGDDVSIEIIKLLNTTANATGNKYDNTIQGNAIANQLDGGAGNDILIGNGGNDTLRGGLGNNTLDGGAGDDTYFVTSSEDKIIDSAGALDVVFSTVSYKLASGIENLSASDGVQSITTGVTFVGNEGNNRLSGGSGNDILDGGNGADLLIGGAGNDIYIVDTAGDVISETDVNDSDTVRSLISYVLADKLENLTLLGSYDLTGTGNGDKNIIIGNSGNNRLNGLGGDDYLDGGDGSDILSGGDGNDTYIINVETDVVIDTGGVDTVRSSASTNNLGAGIENLILIGVGPRNGNGNALRNEMTGNNADNIFYGEAGDDVISGGGGDDSMDGGDGDDTLRGDAGNDTFHGGPGKNILIGGTGNDIYFGAAGIVELKNGGRDTIKDDHSVSLVKIAQVENVTITGIGSFSGTGNTLANVLTGNGASNRLSGLAGNDKLDGGTGNDKLDGGLGQDKLYGGAGADDFIFRAKETGTSKASADTIYDFTGVDDIDLHLIDANSKASGSQPFHFIGKNAFSGHAGELRFDKLSSDTYIYADTNGDRKADLVIHLDDAVNISKAHFIL